MLFLRNLDPIHFLFCLFSTIHVNQIGFVPTAPKFAYLSHYMGSLSTSQHQNGALDLDAYQGSEFYLVRMNDDSVVYTGTMSKQRDKSEVDFIRKDFQHPNMTRAEVWQCCCHDLPLCRLCCLARHLPR